jgi:hypothetical protein
LQHRKTRCAAVEEQSKNVAAAVAKAFHPLCHSSYLKRAKPEASMRVARDVSCLYADVN